MTRSGFSEERQIRAFYTKDFVRVYQAYSDTIADSALENGTFVSPPFSMTRMTWIKPSFLWMMYRAGWGMKDKDQKRILAIDISHNGFKEILEQGITNHFLPENYNSPYTWKNKIRESNVVVQWDPERDIQLNKLNYRTIQVGLRGNAVQKYVQEWVLNISDITNLSHDIHNLVLNGRIEEANFKLPKEKHYDFTNF
ncbi:uncharacterized protein DUF4291 [Enterobacter sp. BIGb0383]|uniref:DUF4291 domain-containing protein n=1 Tax=unclassified Enterobacter TaxID=2608935 RepID=UPI000F46B961|nr:MULTISPECIES: DUF4291 domain-containing protein [unclassified Enterobacter]ROP59944.1 uncharacterized protein DUF4291 [Enterobacter sp. BIGb0383]ROS08587.1 uncharacterized protein DUF4291 [Enterobacter sp. BIGb0359]